MKRLDSRPIHACRRGFSLIELSIVLVIIGIILGAVLEGTSLVHQAHLQSALNDFNKIGNAYNQFKQTYGAKPGDFSNAGSEMAAPGQNATDVWDTPRDATNVAFGNPTATADANGNISVPTYSNATCFNNIVAGNPATCNGNGNGVAGIGFVSGPYQVVGTTVSLTDPNEMFTAFQQLSNAKLLDGGFSGNAAGGAQPGVNVPISAIDVNASYMIVSQQIINDATTAAQSPYYFYGNYGDLSPSVANGLTIFKPGAYIVMGSIGSAISGNAGSSNLPENELLTPTDAYALDHKMDDGLPASGVALTYFSYPDSVANSCVTGATDASSTGAAYNTTNDNPACNFIYVHDVVVN